MSPAVTSGSARPLSADAIAASEALASRERQDAAAKQREGKGKVSLGGSLSVGGKAPDLDVLGKRADSRIADRREAEAKAAMYGGPMDKRMRVADEFQDATPEQLARARTAPDLGAFGGGGTYGVAAGVRFFEDPFTSLAARGSLHKDKAVNDALFQAGIRYRNAVRTAGFDGSAKAMDLTKDIVDGGDPSSGLANAERVAEAGKIVAEAQKVLHAAGRNLLPFIEAIVVRDQTIEQTWPVLSRERSRSAGYVFTVKLLGEALSILAHHWDLMPRDKHRPITSCGADGVRFYERGRKKSA